MKKKKRNNEQKMLLNIKINKDLNWRDVEVITGYTRQNIDHAFRNGTQKTIEKVLESFNPYSSGFSIYLKDREKKESRQNASILIHLDFLSI